jgi:hypothetical protein
VAGGLDRGALIVNDVSALRYDSGLAHVVARRRGGGADAQPDDPWIYREADIDVAREVAEELRERPPRRRRASTRANPRRSASASPSARNTAGPAVRPAGTRDTRRPCWSPLRKSFLKAAIGERNAGQRDQHGGGSTTAVLLGAYVVRVHAVAEMVDVVRTADAIRSGW